MILCKRSLLIDFCKSTTETTGQYNSVT